MANDLQTALRTIAEYPVTDLSNLDAVNMRHIAQAALTAPVATEQAQAVAENFIGYLCRAWGETEHPSVELVRDLDSVRRFMVREWLGEEDATDYDGTPTLPAIMEEIEGRDWRGEGEWHIEFEIGGVSVEQVFGTALAASPEAAPATPATPSDSILDSMIQIVRDIFGGQAGSSDIVAWETMNDRARNRLRAALAQPAPVQRGHLGSTVDGGIDDHDEDRPHQDDSGAAQDAGDDAGATGAAGGTGENQHHQHRAGQADDQRASVERDCTGTGLPGEDSIREAVAAIIRDLSELEGEVEDGQDALVCTVDDLRIILERHIAAPVQQDAPAPSMVGDAAMLHGVDALLREAYAHWDADREFKVGKILLALIGHSKGYDKRSDAFRAAISGQKPAEGET